MRNSFLNFIQSIRQKMIMQMNGPYSISKFFILLFKTQFIASKLYLYIPESIILLNCQCNVFLTIYVAIIITTAIKKDCTHSNNCGIQLHDGDLEHILMKQKKKIFLCFSSHFYVFLSHCHSRFRFRNLKDNNSCIFW